MKLEIFEILDRLRVDQLDKINLDHIEKGLRPLIEPMEYPASEEELKTLLQTLIDKIQNDPSYVKK